LQSSKRRADARRFFRAWRMPPASSPAVIFESGTQKSSSSPGRRLVIRVLLPLGWIVASALGLKLKSVAHQGRTPGEATAEGFQ
jgi:hypothetical protein